MKLTVNYAKKAFNIKQSENLLNILKNHTKSKLKRIEKQEEIEAFLVKLDICAKITEGIIEISKNNIGMHIALLFEELYILNNDEFSDAKQMLQMALSLSENIVFTTEKGNPKIEIYMKFYH